MGAVIMRLWGEVGGGCRSIRIDIGFEIEGRPVGGASSGIVVDGGCSSFSIDGPCGRCCTCRWMVRVRCRCICSVSDQSTKVLRPHWSHKVVSSSMGGLLIT